jgi:hypothetical protein
MGVYLFGFATAALLLSTLSTLGKPYFAVLLFLAATRILLAGLYEVARRVRPSTRSQAASPSRARPSRSTAAPRSGSRTRQREVLPLFRRGAAGESFAGCERQLDRLEAEPGVRQQL